MKTSAVVLTVLCVALSAGLTAGCVKNYPTREAVQGAPAGILKLSNAPADARLIAIGSKVTKDVLIGGPFLLHAGRIDGGEFDRHAAVADALRPLTNFSNR